VIIEKLLLAFLYRLFLYVADCTYF
jgi:hypothetical protein